jgi:KDO2-lipid IV(A) lauroyltransferase
LAKRKSAAAVLLEYAAAGFALGSLRFTPLPVANRLARVYAKILDRAIPRLRRVAETNLSLAMPQLPAEQHRRIIDGVFRSLARLLLAFARFPDINSNNVGTWIRYEGLEHYQAAKTRGRGILVATAHLGNWELSAFAHAIRTEPMHVMVRALDNPKLDDLVETRRALSGNRLILKKDGALSVVRALKQNEAVGMLIDQNAAPEESVFVQFFGKPAAANIAFTKIAARTGAAVVPGFALWEAREQRYVLRFYPEIELTGDAHTDTQRIHSFFEQVIRQYPDQWMWIHRRWKTRPPGDPDIY